MSRVGKAAIHLEKNIKFQIKNEEIEISYDNKTTKKKLSDGISINLSDDNSKIHLLVDKTQASHIQSVSRMYGTERSLIKAAVDGIVSGHYITLELVGVGYKAITNNGFLILTLGYSHDIIYAIHKDISVTVEKSNTIIIKSLEKRLVGLVASEIIKFRPHEPYKGKGIKIRGNNYVRKEGKKK